MKLVRTATAVAVAGTLLGTGISHAAVKAKPVCKIVSDAAGDAQVIGPEPSSDALDVVSADIASSKNTVTAVIRVKALSAKSNTSPTGMTWTFRFSIDGTVIEMLAHAGPTGTVTYDSTYAGTAGNTFFPAGTTGVFDTKKNEIRISAPVGLLQAQSPLGKNSVFTDINVTAGNEIAVPDATGVFGGTLFSYSPFTSDDAVSTKTYKAGTKSCVVPGK